jgi:hypothetical protein
MLGVAGACAICLAALWMTRDRSPRWSRFHFLSQRSVDQRWLLPIAISVDAAIGILGILSNASRAFWILVAGVVTFQAVFIALTLWSVRRRPHVLSESSHDTSDRA